MQSTKSFNLQKPDYNNIVDVMVLNQNFDRIDQGLTLNCGYSTGGNNTYELTIADIENLTEEDIAEVISSWTKIPVKKLTQDENEKLRNENVELRSQIDFINTLPQEQLNDLVTLSLELEGTKGQYENAIKAANVAKEKYEEAMKDIIDLKKRYSYK